MSIQLTEDPKQGLNRVHLDLYTTDQAGEVRRLEGLGASRVPWKYPEVHDHIVMADPDGNEFCVIQSPFAQD